jgi:hypothetical protein
MAAATYDIDTLANVKVFMGIGAADATRDVLLQTLISSWSGYIESETGRTFKVRDVTGEILDGNGREKIRPKKIPIYQPYLSTDSTDALKLAAIQTRVDIDTAWADLEDDLTQFWVNTPELREESDNNTHNIEFATETFPDGKRTVKLNYQPGYATMPGDILIVFYQMVQREYAKSKAGDNQLAQTNLNDSRSNINISIEDLMPKWRQVLERYRVKYR